MTDAPERIWANIEPEWMDGDGNLFVGGTWDAGHLKDGIEYVRADVAAAMVAAALREAAEVAYQWWDDDDAQELRDVIRALIPDAGAALDRALAAAREEGRREEREACAKLAHDLQVSADQINDAYAAKRLPGVFLEPDGYEIAAAIRARADQGETA